MKPTNKRTLIIVALAIMEFLVMSGTSPHLSSANCVLPTVFALFVLEISLQEVLNWNPSNQFITIAGIVVFLAAGCFFGGLDKSDKKKQIITSLNINSHESRK